MLERMSYLLLILFLFSCHNTAELKKSGEKKPQNPNQMVLTGQIIEKPFYKKNGQQTDLTELYFRASIQDYFIKFCESQVERVAVEPFIDQALSIHAEIREGNWDICPTDPSEMQSRIGSYIIIQSIQP